MFKGTKILERDEHGKPTAFYNCLKYPLMDEREMVLKSIIRDDTKSKSDGKYFVLLHSYEREDCPIHEDKIRIDFFRGMLFWETKEGIKTL